MSPAVTSTRWCPTPEQLMILEEMYRSGGVRTPNATQIQQITSHLSNYGKIEGKNVFYWFQNHKARDRQKLKRKLLIKQQQQSHPDQHGHHLLYYHASLPAPPQPYFSPAAPAPFFPQHQGGGLFHEEASSSKTMNYTWKVADISPEIVVAEKPPMTMRMYGQDGSMMKMMLDVGPNNIISVPCQNRPLKTLELFPIKATNLKDECNNSSSSSYLIN